MQIPTLLLVNIGINKDILGYIDWEIFVNNLARLYRPHLLVILFIQLAGKDWVKGVDQGSLFQPAASKCKSYATFK